MAQIILSDDGKETARNGYMMSLAVFITTMPIPIINLLANLFYYLSHRKESYELRWHCYCAFLSQIPIFFINCGTWYLAWNILWDSVPFNNFTLAYFIMAAIVNVWEIVMSCIACVRVSNGKDVNWSLISPLTHILCRKVSWDVWSGGWKSADEKYLQMKEEAYPVLKNDLIVHGALICALFLFIASCNIVGKMGNPNPSVVTMLDKAMTSSIKHSEVKNKDASNLVAAIADRITVDNNIDSMNIMLIKNSEVNAFAFCRRNIAVQTGMVNECDNADELAAVMAHEMAHIECKHVINNTRDALGVSIVFSAFLGDLSGIATTLTTNAFSREAEEEADKTALLYLYNAGIDPNSFVSVMKKFLEMQGEAGNSRLIEILSTHPATQKRIDYAEAMIKTFAPKKYSPVMSDNEWQTLKKGCKTRSMFSEDENNVEEKNAEKENENLEAEEVIAEVEEEILETEYDESDVED